MELERIALEKKFYDIIKHLEVKHRKNIYNAIFEYIFNKQILVPLDEKEQHVFTLIKEYLDEQVRYQKILYIKRENGKKGGRPKLKPEEKVAYKREKEKEILNKLNEILDKKINNFIEENAKE